MYSGVAPVLAPKPPPTSGEITRTWSASSPRTRARSARKPCGAWLDAHTVSRVPGASPGTATTPRGSSATGATRGLSTRTCATTSASWKARSTSPPSFFSTKQMLLSSSGCTRGASAARAVSADATDGCGSYSTSTRSAASCAAPADSATMTATGSPTAATRPRASGGNGGTLANGNGIGGTSPTWGMSSTVATATTPGYSRAAAVSIAVTRALGYGERTNARSSTSSGCTSSTYLPLPVRKRESSTRRIGLPVARCTVMWARVDDPGLGYHAALLVAVATRATLAAWARAANALRSTWVTMRAEPEGG